MEMLNNIWSFLNTPNEQFINITSIPILFFIEIPLIMYMFIYALDISATRKQKIIYIASMSIVGLLSNFVIPSPFNVIFNYGLTFISIIFIFKLNVFKAFIAIIIQIVIPTLIGTLTANPFITILNLTYEQTATVPIYRYSYLLVFYLILLGIDLILKQRKVVLNAIDSLDRKSKVILFANLGFGLLAIILQVLLNFYYINVLPVLMSVISSISLLAYFGISIYSLTRVTKLALTTQELESAEAYNKSLSILHDRVRVFKHEFDNIVATIGGYVKTDDMEGLKKYYNQLEDECQKVNNIAALNPNIINNPGVFNLLSTKYHKADEENIKINLEFFLDLDTLNMKIYDFSKILGILLDNAIDAAKDCNEKIINIKFRNEQNKNRQVIIIENTYNNKNIDTEEIFNKGYTEKENHSGLGLWEIRQILKKNNNLNLFTTKDAKLFKQQLEIYPK